MHKNVKITHIRKNNLNNLTSINEIESIITL